MKTYNMSASLKLPEEVRLNLVMSRFKNQIEYNLTINPIQVNRTIVSLRTSVVSCSWTKSWWAKLIHKILRYKLGAKLVPYSIACLANATEVTYQPSTKQLSIDIFQNILEQITYYRMSGITPTKIILGKDKQEDVFISDKYLHFSYAPVYSPEKGINSLGKIYGLEVIVSNFISPDSVLVV